MDKKKTLWKKEKLLVTSNFSFFHSVFKRLVLQTRKKRLVWERVNGNTTIVNGAEPVSCRSRPYIYFAERVEQDQLAHIYIYSLNLFCTMMMQLIIAIQCIYVSIYFVFAYIRNT